MSCGKAIAYGAATIVNAIAIGKGAAFGLDLKTEAKVELTDEAGVVRGKILPSTNEDTRLIEEAVKVVFDYFRVEKKFGAKVETMSNIPIARGLKSSSIAANAIILATLTALGKSLDDETIIDLSVKAAFRAKTTITGAFDDVCASYFGGIVVTDNVKRKVIRREKIAAKYKVLIYVPKKKAYTVNVNTKRVKLIAPYVKIAFEKALNRKYWEALTLNGLLYSSILGYTTDIVFDALNAGAIASGLSGKGPAVVAVVKNHKLGDVLDVWKKYGEEILIANVNNKKSSISV
ncbi:MAG: shikimate kinase [Candidatus Bathyarchaeota archaeon]|nr:shikimate kinase [Candidatus Bathyarchaeota archaeon]